MSLRGRIENGCRSPQLGILAYRAVRASGARDRMRRNLAPEVVEQSIDIEHEGLKHDRGIKPASAELGFDFGRQPCSHVFRLAVMPRHRRIQESPHARRVPAPHSRQLPPSRFQTNHAR